MKTLSIRALLISSMAIMAALLVLSAAMSVAGLSRANSHLEEMYANRMVSATALGESMTYLLRARTALDRIVLEPQSPESQQTLQRALGFSAKSDAAWQRYLALPAAPDEVALSDAVQVQRKSYLERGERAMVAALQAGREDDARALMLHRMAPLFTALSTPVDALTGYQTNRAAALFQQSQAAYASLLWWTGGGLLLALLLVAASAVLLSRAIVRPLDAALGHMRAIGAGDLTEIITAMRDDEMGRLAAGLARMQSNLIGTMTSVLDGSKAIGLATGEIAEGTASLSARTEAQASALEETASSIEELTSTVQQNASHAERAAQLAASVKDRMGHSSGQVGQVADLMSEMLGASQRINEITGLIEGIAFQTNLLALNAAVEAARAGEQGRGFAVVAAEVRSLAQRCANAAKDVGGQIAVSVQLARSGSGLAEQAGASTRAVLADIEEVSRIVSDISFASQEQAAGIEQVNEAILQMDDVTQHNAALVEESLAASHALHEQAAGLDRLVSGFKLRGQSRPAGAVRLLA